MCLIYEKNLADVIYQIALYVLVEIAALPSPYFDGWL